MAPEIEISEQQSKSILDYINSNSGSFVRGLAKPATLGAEAGTGVYEIDGEPIVIYSQDNIVGSGGNTYGPPKRFLLASERHFRALEEVGIFKPKVEAVPEQATVAAESEVD